MTVLTRLLEQVLDESSELSRPEEVAAAARLPPGSSDALRRFHRMGPLSQALADAVQAESLHVNGLGCRVAFSPLEAAGVLCDAAAAGLCSPAAAVERMADLLETETAGATAVVCLRGLKVNDPIAFSESLTLVAFEDVREAEHYARVVDAVKPELAYQIGAIRRTPTAALCMKATVAPLFVRTGDGADLQPLDDAPLRECLGAIRAVTGLPIREECWWSEHDDAWLGRLCPTGFSWEPPGFLRRAAALGQEDVDLVRAYLALAPTVRRRLAIAANRFGRALAADDEAALLDTAIGLEVALSSKGDGGSIAQRLSMRAALLHTPDLREAAYDLAREVYRARNVLAHAGTTAGERWRLQGAQVDLATLRHRGEQLAVSVMRALVRRGGPPSNWVQIELGLAEEARR